MDKKYTGKVLLWLQFAFFNEEKKNANFLGFLRFSQIQGPGSKIRDWYIIVDYFPEHLKPMLTLDHIEMGNLEAKEKLNKVWNLKSVPALLLAAKWSVAKCILLTNWKTFMLHTLQFSQLACLTLMNYFSNNRWSDKAILRTKKKES